MKGMGLMVIPGMFRSTSSWLRPSWRSSLSEVRHSTMTQSAKWALLVQIFVPFSEPSTVAPWTPGS